MDAPATLHEPDEVLLGFARALRAAGVPVTLDRTRTWRGRRPGRPRRAAGDVLGGPGDAVRRPRRPRPLRPGLRRVVPGQGGAAAQPAADHPHRAGPGRAARRRALRRRRRRRGGRGGRPGQRDRGAAPPRHRRAHRRRAGGARRDVRGPCIRTRRGAARTGVPPGGGVRSTPTARCARPSQRMGEPGPVQWRRRGTRPRRVVLLIDVSGSMSPYADALLRFAHAARGQRRRPRRPRCSRSAPGSPASPGSCGSATPSGPWPPPARPSPTGPAAPGSARSSRRSSTGGASAGWPAAPWSCSSATAGSAATPSLLAAQMARLHRLAHRVVWVNPHSGKAGYEPVQRRHGGGAAARRRLRGRAHAGDVRPSLRGGGGAVRDVLPELLGWWRDGRDRRPRHRRRHLPVRAAPARRLDAGRSRRRGGRAASPAAASRARSTSWPGRRRRPASRSSSATASATTTRSPSA